MNLSCKNPWNSNQYATGVYINKVNVANVEDISGQQPPYLDTPYDIGVKLTLDIGREFQPELIIAGNFKRDAITGEVTGWGSAFVVQEALSKLGNYTGELIDGNKIPAEILEGMIGKEFYRLTYISGIRENGKARYFSWNHIATLEDGAESLMTRFKRSLEKGYPRNYRPAVLDQPSPVGVVASSNQDEDPF